MAKMEGAVKKEDKDGKGWIVNNRLIKHREQGHELRGSREWAD